VAVGTPEELLRTKSPILVDTLGSVSSVMVVDDIPLPAVKMGPISEPDGDIQDIVSVFASS
jgi:hypothetical protein